MEQQIVGFILGMAVACAGMLAFGALSLLRTAQHTAAAALKGVHFHVHYPDEYADEDDWDDGDDDDEDDGRPAVSPLGGQRISRTKAGVYGEHERN